MKSELRKKTFRDYMEMVDDFNDQQPIDDLGAEIPVEPEGDMSVSVGFGSELPGEVGEMEGSMMTQLTELGAEVINTAQEIQNFQFEDGHIDDISTLSTALNHYQNKFLKFSNIIENMRHDLEEFSKQSIDNI